MNKIQSMLRMIAQITPILFLTACSVGMAAHGQKDPNLGAIRVGSTRGEIEIHLGSPIKTASAENEWTSNVYEYEIGNEPSAGRAVFHGLMDVFTFGLWEIVGTPVEGFQGKKYQITILYDQDDVCRKIQ